MPEGSQKLIPVPYDGANQSLFADFNCGPSQFGIIATEWIKGPQLFKSLARGNSVWAYLGPDDAVVGYASLGTTTWNLGGQKIKLGYIAMVGIDHRYQGQPPASDFRDRYSGQIMTHLIEQATGFQLPFLGLHCDPANNRGMPLYRKFDFKELPNRDKHGNFLMVRRMRNEPKA